MTRARDLADLGGSANAGTITGESLIINGDMAVAQRGTSSSTLSGYGSVDRFTTNSSGTDQLAITQAQVSDAPDGFKKSFKITVTTAETAVASDEYLRIYQGIEGQNLQRLAYGTANAKQLTLSFWVKSSVTGTYANSLYIFDANRIFGGTYTIDTADTWEYKTLTLDADTAGSLPNDDASAGAYLNFSLMAGSNFTGGDNTSWGAYDATKLLNGHTAAFATTANATWQVTGIKLEIGSTATPFKHESYGENLRLCERYYQTLNILNTSYSAAISYSGGGNSILPTSNFSKMRAAPTVAFDSAGNIEYYTGSGWSDTTVLAQDITDNYAVFLFSGNASPGTLIRTDEGGPFTVTLSSEL